MIYTKHGNLFASTAQTLVNAVNIKERVMGAGIAKQFKLRYPAMYVEYQQSKELAIGVPVLCKLYNTWVMNFPTKYSYRDSSTLEYIKQGLTYLVENYKQLGITSIAFPKIGCGLGGLKWEEVKPVMVHYLNQLDIDVFIYE